MTQCNSNRLEFQPLANKQVTGEFSALDVTSDAGGLLLRETEKGRRIVQRFAQCFQDHRNADLIEHTVLDLIGQRVYGICLGYEDLNDHDTLRHDPLLATLVGKLDPTGQSRRRERDRGCALSGKSTLNRMELTAQDATVASRYKKVVYDQQSIDRLLVQLFLEAYPQAPEQIWLDLDATDDTIHGNQEYRTVNSWSTSRRVVGKAEYLDKGANPRFIVTNLSGYHPRALYEDLYCARGDMENRIKEQQLGLFADRTSTELFRANQLRLYFSSMAYVLMSELRRVGLVGTELESAQVGTIRQVLLKIGAVIKVSVRRIFIQFSRAYPKAELFWAILQKLRAAPA
jgi:hypothetical protein